MRVREGITREEALRLRALRDTVTDAPSPGVNVGASPHVATVAEWDGSGRVPPGWTGVPGIESDGRGTYSVAIPDDMEAKIAERALRLDEAQRSELEAEVALAKSTRLANREEPVPLEEEPVRVRG